jgi:hypothetical protein
MEKEEGIAPVPEVVEATEKRNKHREEETKNKHESHSTKPSTDSKYTSNSKSNQQEPREDVKPGAQQDDETDTEPDPKNSQQPLVNDDPNSTSNNDRNQKKNHHHQGSNPLFSDGDQSDAGQQSHSSISEFTEASAFQGGGAAQQQQQYHPMNQHQQTQPFPYPAPSWPMHPATESLQYYEAQMRDHAAAYASAAAGAAWAAAQIAAGVDSSGSFNAPMMLPNMPLQGDPPPPIVAPHDGGGSAYSGSANVPQFQQPPQPHFQPYPSSPPGLQGQPTPPPLGVPPPYYFSAPTQDHHFRSPPATGGEDGGYHYNRHRRKRQQRMRPSEAPAGRQNQQQRSFSQGSNHSQSDVTTAASVDSSEHHQRRRRKSSNHDSSGGGRKKSYMPAAGGGASSSSDGYYSQNNKKKPRQPTDDSLLGKTAVPALYEWCGKRRTAPVFDLISQHESSVTSQVDFEISVAIDSEVVGRGRGGSKATAKQDAAQKALQALLPGVAFDEESGVLIHLPKQNRKQKQLKRPPAPTTSLEELAPHLEKTLAIGQPCDDLATDKAAKKRKPMGAGRPLQRLQHAYPGTSTTSEEEDENAYYASRGASICSTLLHAMVQIDERIVEPPQYTYEVQNSVPSLATNTHKRKTSPSIDSHRGSFSCQGTLMLKEKELEGNDGDKSSDEGTIEVLRALGAGATKREARHIASAKLLALLFPECDGMVQVKEAAEAAREKYAASKALKLQSKRTGRFHAPVPAGEGINGTSYLSRSSNGEASPRFLEVLSAANDPSVPELPVHITSHFKEILRNSSSQNTENSTATKGNSDQYIPRFPRDEISQARQLSRQQQLEDQLMKALQQLNEHDEEGRVLPDEITVDDVGRTGKSFVRFLPTYAFLI